MTLGSLFAGIGGFELAATWAGITPIWSNEIDPFCCKVLRKNFKHRIIEDDIRNIGAHNLEAVDILTGGFPCQPFSTAGKRKGTKDYRHLWPEMLRVAGEIHPRWIVGENVPGLLNLQGGMVLKQIKTDLENEGFEVLPLLNIPACSKDARHRRERIWIIAHNNRYGFGNGSERKTKGREGFTLNQTYSQITTHLDSIGIQRELQKEISGREGITWGQTELQLTDSFRRSDTFEPKLCRTLHGIPFGVDRIKSLGNSIVPQVAFEIFKAIQKVNETTR